MKRDLNLDDKLRLFGENLYSDKKVICRCCLFIQQRVLKWSSCLKAGYGRKPVEHKGLWA